MENKMTFTGKIIAITEKITGENNGKTWEKQSLIIQEEADKYPQKIVIEAFNKADIIGKLEVGDNITAHFNVVANEYNGKWYGSNSLWKIEKKENDTTAALKQAPSSPSTLDKDLPF